MNQIKQKKQLNTKLPENTVIEGIYCDLEPVNWDIHTQSLFENLKDSDIWTYLPCQVPDSPEKIRNFFTSINKNENKCLGLIGYMNSELENQATEMYVVFSKQIQRTTITTQVVYLAFKYAIQQCGFNRLMWKCHDKNQKCIKAADRLGLKFQGVLRDHWVMKGCYRTSKYYSILGGQWDLLKQQFERWLNKKNFNDKGEQQTKLRLKEIRSRMQCQQ